MSDESELTIKKINLLCLELASYAGKCGAPMSVLGHLACLRECAIRGVNPDPTGKHVFVDSRDYKTLLEEVERLMKRKAGES